MVSFGTHFWENLRIYDELEKLMSLRNAKTIETFDAGRGLLEKR